MISPNPDQERPKVVEPERWTASMELRFEAEVRAFGEVLSQQAVECLPIDGSAYRWFTQWPTLMVDPINQGSATRRARNWNPTMYEQRVRFILEVQQRTFSFAERGANAGRFDTLCPRGEGLSPAPGGGHACS